MMIGVQAALDHAVRTRASLSSAAVVAVRAAATILERWSGARLTVLIFHRVLPHPDPLFPDIPDAARFESMLRALRRCFRIVPLSEALEQLAAGTLPHRTASITFDDGYADNFTIALPVLKRLGVSATFFIAPGFLDGGRMWNDTVIEAIRSCRDEVLDLSRMELGVYPLTTDRQRRLAIDAVLGRLKYVEFRRRLELAARIAEHSSVPLPDDLMMSRSQVKGLAEQGMTLGAHTVNHPILANIDDRTAESEIVESRHTLESLAGIPVTLFAYPNGTPVRDYDARHVAMLKRNGFRGAVSTAIGAAGYDADLYQIPRFTPWSREPWKFCLQLAHNLQRTRYAIAQ